jgi:flagellin
MALSILNNISSMTAENALSNTQANLQKTLTQLSTGLKINSGSDDAAGLSIAQGMTANIAALTQSQQNASNGVGMLQTADGALSETNTLLNRAVTLATEGASSGITSSQSTALNTEYQSILSEINQIGSTSNFNGANVFGTSASATITGTAITGLTGTTTLTAYTAGSANTAKSTANTAGGTLTTASGTWDTSTLGSAAATVLNTAATALTAAATALGTTTAAGIAATSAASALTTAATAAGTTALDAAHLSAAQTAATAGATALTNAATAMPATTGGTGTITITDTTSGKSLTITQGNTAASATSTDNKAYTSTATTADDLNSQITAVFGGSVTAAIVPSADGTKGTETITSASADNFTITSTDSKVVGTSPTGGTATAATENVNSVYIGDGTTTGASNTTISTSIDSLSAGTLKLSSTDLTNATDAATALTAITAAITQVSAQRGVIGASVNRLTAANADMSNEVTNLQSAANSIQNADIGKTVANMTQYNVLQSTGMAALQQSNQAQQAVLKLVQ